MLVFKDTHILLAEAYIMQASLLLLLRNQKVTVAAAYPGVDPATERGDSLQ